MAVRRHGRGSVTVAAVVSLAVMWAGGCSGAGDDDGFPGAPGTGSGVPTGTTAGRGRPAETAGTGARALAEIRGAADTLVAAGSARTRTAMETAAGGTRVTIRGHGGYDFRRRTGQLTVVLPQTPAGADDRRPVTELLTAGALYMKNRGAGVPADKWVRVDTATLADGNLVTGGATDPLAAAELLRGVRELVAVGTEDLGGVRVRHYRGSVDIARAARLAGPYARAALAAAVKGFTTDVVPFDVLLDDEGRLRKVSYRFTFTHRGATAPVTSVTELFAFGTPVVVRLPDRRDIYTGRIRG
ncbi:hypothetical protein ABT354_34720 [Streptomyces sp. NPDC000594]|uniref:hypothetical protein n=1 Tax=Streptomyces sp. NPDC000594 TaxID=3154261 RepID=UPI003324E25F